MKFYMDNTLKKHINSNQTLGTLKKIAFHFKGSGKVDWIKVYQGNKMALQEDFAVTGKSSIKWMQ
jgi:hypothetical protein